MGSPLGTKAYILHMVRTFASCRFVEPVMPVREFIDGEGTEWRAWEVTPDALFPPTRGEDYLADCYQSGWVVMETREGDRRVRLCPIPRDWQRLADEALAALIPRAEVLPARTVTGRGPLADLHAARSFRYPGGGAWTVSLSAHPTVPGARVLRFSGSARVIDLEEWPRDWADQSDDDLVSLLRRAAPPGVLPRAPNDGAARPDGQE